MQYKLTFGMIKSDDNFSWKVILHGIPVSSSRGFLGWCSVSLLKFRTANGSQYFLFDTGNVGDRSQLLYYLEKSGVTIDKISGVILSHLHYDHVLNAELFNCAKFYVSAKELEYFRKDSNEDLYYPRSYLDNFLSENGDRIITVEDNDELFAAIFVLLPGHSAGSTGFLYNETLFAGDALKYGKEAIMKKSSFAYFNQEEADRSLERMLSMAKLIVPGHDALFRIGDGKISYLKRSITYLDLYEIRGNGLKIREI